MTRPVGMATWGRPSFVRGVRAEGTGTAATQERTGTAAAEKTGTLEGPA